MRNETQLVFPQDTPGLDGDSSIIVRRKGGMSLRDHFAACAMTGLVASGSTLDEVAIAAKAYRMADKMLQEASVGVN